MKNCSGDARRPGIAVALDVEERAPAGSGVTARQGHRSSHRMVAETLHELGYSLQANAKTIESARHPDRNAQFEYIDEKVGQFLAQRCGCTILSFPN